MCRFQYNFANFRSNLRRHFSQNEYYQLVRVLFCCHYFTVNAHNKRDTHPKNIKTVFLIRREETFKNPTSGILNAKFNVL